jgi:tetratricopeptide (TPR) repeat protein
VRLDQLSGGFVTEVRTDRLGKFRIPNLAPIQYQVIIRQPGYQEIQREVNLIMSGSEYLQLQLLPEQPAIETVHLVPRILDANVPLEARKEFERGQLLIATADKSKTAEGIRHLQRAITLYSGFLEAKLSLGTAYMDLKQWSEAEQVLVQANAAHPGTANVLFALGELFIQEGKAVEAEKVLIEGLEIEPRSWQGHFTLGRLYWSRGDIVKAGPQVGLVIQLNPNLAEAHLLAGNILLRARKIDDAKFEFEEYLRLAPKGKYVIPTKEVLQKLKKARNS